jgi:hypothetical protein
VRPKRQGPKDKRVKLDLEALLFGDGYCKFADRCKFDHSGPQGGSKRAREFGRGGIGKSKGKNKGKEEDPEEEKEKEPLWLSKRKKSSSRTK